MALLIAIMLVCLRHFKIAFNIGINIFFSKGIDLFKLWNIQVFNWIREKSIQNFCISSFCLKILSPSTGVIFSEGFDLLNNKGLIVFRKCLLFRISFSLYFHSNRVLLSVEKIITVITLFQVRSFVSMRSIFQETITKVSLLHVSRR